MLKLKMAREITFLIFVCVFVSPVLCGYCTRSRTCYYNYYTSCGTWGWSRCGATRAYTCYYQDCCSGWKGYQCNTPICPTPCYNGGTCVAPDKCACLPSYRGDPYCTTLLCSGKAPCYPGTCSYPSTCACIEGFDNPSSGCLSFSNKNNPPVIEECDLTLANIRRTDQKQLFYFNAPCSESTRTNTIWCNQELFNYVNLSMSSHYPAMPYLPPPPSYVVSNDFGVVYSGMNVVHTKYPRPDTLQRFIAFNNTYPCSGFSADRPKNSSAPCFIEEKNYKINIEHDDIFTVTYTTQTGGFRVLYDQDIRRNLPTQYYKGQMTQTTIEFKFDFIAPVHCSETESSVKCTRGEKPINIESDITKLPLRPTWDGWSDGLSGISYFYLEIFELQPDIHNELTELEPLKPIFTFRTNLTANIDFPTFTPGDTGMYSILLQASDMANNSKIARRLVLYDKGSSITLTKPGFLEGKPMNVSTLRLGDGGMHVVSAKAETGYMWQTSEENDMKTHIIIDWQNHFVNQVVERKKLLNKVLPYPTQFANLEDDGVLRSKKYVSLDDNEGLRTLNAVQNVHGIVKFEINRVFTDNREVPQTGWVTLDNLTERYELWEKLDDGSHIRLWVRATDIVNNTLTDYTEVHIDNTPPRFDRVVWKTNIKNGTYVHTSRIQFVASDDGSGVHLLEYKLFVGDSADKHDGGYVSANRDNATDACAKKPECHCILNTCFLLEQTLDIDNCMFIVPKEDLNKTGRVDVKIYNQALLFQEFSVNITRLSDLDGLEEYSGPTNIRVEKNLATGVRLRWDLPKTASCYGRANIQVILVGSDGNVRVITLFSEETSVDLVGLDPESDYSVALKLGYKGTELATMQPFSFKTAAQENFLAAGAIVGIVIGVVAIIGILIAIFVVMLRRGHMAPVRRGLHAVSVKYRKSVAQLGGGKHRNNTYDNSANRDSLYMYGEMDFKDIQSWQLSRDDVVLQSVLKSGTFADIYMATIRSSKTTVVAKTLKNGYSKQDELLMKAKIHFNATEVGNHENILKFVGAVCSETETGVGPFIIFEYCSNGTLKDYLETAKDLATIEMQERLLRFGLGVARGMEYLAGRKIIHRRLAARNILLNDAFEIKIYGFGPQPDQDADRESSNKRERIPMKWMAPECLKSTVGATEKSDVWSFGVVLWEIFSHGKNPYENVRGRELPVQLKSGYRLPKPEQCDDKWYGVMKRSWEEDPARRPNFKQIRSELDEVFVSAPVDDYYYYRK